MIPINGLISCFALLDPEPWIYSKSATSWLKLWGSELGAEGWATVEGSGFRVGQHRLWQGSVHMSHSPNSFKGGYIGDYIENYYRSFLKGDTRSLDHRSHGCSGHNMGCSLLGSILPLFREALPSSCILHRAVPY